MYESFFKIKIKVFWQIRSTWRYSLDTDLTQSAHSQTRYADSVPIEIKFLISGQSLFVPFFFASKVKTFISSWLRNLSRKKKVLQKINVIFGKSSCAQAATQSFCCCCFFFQLLELRCVMGTKNFLMMRKSTEKVYKAPQQNFRLPLCLVKLWNFDHF